MPLRTLLIPPYNRKRKRIAVSSSDDEVVIVDSRPQKHAKLDGSRLDAREEEVYYSPVLKDQITTTY